jgi:hypothetical protein
MKGAKSTLIAAILLAAPGLAWGEACVNGICATSKTNGGFVSVRYHVQNGPVTHVNIRSDFFSVSNCEGVCPDPSQQEGSPSGAFTLLKNKNGTTAYAIQACVRGGFLQHSKCGAWANFHHGE